MGKFREIDYVRVRDLAVAGASRSAIAQACGLTDAGFYARMKKDEQLAEAFAADGRSRHRNGKPAEPAAEPAIEPLPLEADGDTYDADADLARCVLLDKVQDAVGEGFNLIRAIAHEIGEPIWKVSNALEDLEYEGRVQRVETATYAAYVLPGTVPAGSRPVLNGEGGVTFVTGDGPEAVFVEDGPIAQDLGDDETPYVATANNGNGGDPVWWCIGCGEAVDPDDPAAVVLRPQHKAWCCVACFDDTELGLPAKRNLLKAVTDRDAVSIPLEGGGCVTVEFADVKLTALTEREHELVCELLGLVREWTKETL